MMVDQDTHRASSATEDRARAIAWRRRVFALAGIAIWAGLLALFARALAPGGFGIVEIAILIAFALYLPWSLFGFLNATIGFLVMRLARDPLAATCPPAAAVDRHAPVTAMTAVLWCIRNEDVDRVFRAVALMAEDLGAHAPAGRFAIHILSDTNRPETGADEEAAVAALQARFGVAVPIAYRRRTSNEGYKAGNIRDFAVTAGGAYDFALVLDADSAMTAAKILSMVRIMQATPSLGILQSLVVGLPSTSPLARLFQFGMRLGMRSYTLGSAWWHADCGPYWGHNALIRLAPFTAHCDLPKLPGKPPLGGDILSHDQVEAVLMRRAGYEVRVVPEEGGSYEENPPTLIEFVRREMRWCLGNTQYWRLLDMAELKPTSRFQLVIAVVMFVASPTFLILWSLLLIEALRRQGEVWLDPTLGLWLVAIAVAMIFAPKLASVADVLLDPAKRRGFGGGWRFLASFAIETAFSFLVTPISMVAHTLMMISLLFGRSIGWTAQVRDAHTVPWREAAARFWPQTLIGILAFAGLWRLAPIATVYAAPVYLGLLLATPLAVVTSSPRIGAFMRRIGLAAIPEEIAMPAEVARLMGVDASDDGAPAGAAPLAVGAAGGYLPTQSE